MKLLGRQVAALGFIVCLAAMIAACSSRATPASPPEAAPPIEPPTAPPPAPPSSPTPVTRPEPEPPECAVIADASDAIGTVALPERVDPANAPHPANESERLLFRQIYETLVRVDCVGRVRAGLAASWQRDASGRTWIVTLRENAQFSDGTPVRSSDVRASWTREGGGDELRAPVRRLVESIVVLDDRALSITLHSQRGDLPLSLAHTDLAIAKPVSDSRWPLGTRSERSAVALEAPSGPVITVNRETLAPIRFLVASGDPRDLLDQTVDLLLTQDPATLEYAVTLPHFRLVPLEWQRTEVLLSPGRSRTASSLPDHARQALADDAVRGEARGAVEPFWWETVDDCPIAPPQPRDQRPLTPRIVYDVSDGAARDLAERFVGLVRASIPTATTILDGVLPDRPRRTYQRAAGMSGEPLARARRLGADAGYIVSIDRRPLNPCREAQILSERFRWLDLATILPLVDTRMQAIVRRGRSGISADWDGGLHIAEASASR